MNYDMNKMIIRRRRKQEKQGSRASVLETLLTAQTITVTVALPTATHTEDRRERSTQTQTDQTYRGRGHRLRKGRACCAQAE